MGNGFQFIDIILFGMVAAFLVLRLRSVLGRRDGHEPRKNERGKDPFVAGDDRDNVVHMPGRRDEEEVEAAREERLAREDEEPTPAYEAADETVANGLTQIRIVDPTFDPNEFIEGARAAFEMVLNAYAAGDTPMLKGLLSPDIFGDFERAIREREQAGEKLEDTLVGFKTTDIMEAYVDDNHAHVTVKFVTEQVNVVRDESGDVVDGNPNAVIDVTDFWTFSRDTRSSDPNWTLVATASPE